MTIIIKNDSIKYIGTLIRKANKYALIQVNKITLKVHESKIFYDKENNSWVAIV